MNYASTAFHHCDSNTFSVNREYSRDGRILSFLLYLSNTEQVSHKTLIIIFCSCTIGQTEATITMQDNAITFSSVVNQLYSMFSKL